MIITITMSGTSMGGVTATTRSTGIADACPGDPSGRRFRFRNLPRNTDV